MKYIYIGSPNLDSITILNAVLLVQNQKIYFTGITLLKLATILIKTNLVKVKNESAR